MEKLESEALFQRSSRYRRTTQAFLMRHFAWYAHGEDSRSRGALRSRSDAAEYCGIPSVVIPQCVSAQIHWPSVRACADNRAGSHSAPALFGFQSLDFRGLRARLCRTSLPHGFGALDVHHVRVEHQPVHDGVCHGVVAELRAPSEGANCEHRMSDPFLCLASTISRTSLV